MTTKEKKHMKLVPYMFGTLIPCLTTEYIFELNSQGALTSSQALSDPTIMQGTPVIRLFHAIQFLNYPSGLIFPFLYIAFWAFVFVLSIKREEKIQQKKIPSLDSSSNHHHHQQQQQWHQRYKENPHAQTSPWNSTIVMALTTLGLDTKNPDKLSWPLIHQHYRILAKKYHPDHHQSSEKSTLHAHKLFLKIEEAYGILKKHKEMF